MSGSTLNNCSANEPTCLCGIEVSISTRFGLVEVSFGGGHIVDGELIFTDNQSVVWTDDLGVDYILNFSYNTVLGRWELSYDDIVFGVFYSDSQCPLSECDWDLDCIAIDFIPNGTTAGYYSWTGEYFNGRKAYYFSSDWDGVSTIDYQIVWDLIPPSAGAPVGTYAWILSDVTEGEPIFINFLPATVCPYGEYLSEWGGKPTRFEIANPGVSDYILETKAAECGCCDTTLQLEVGVVELGIVTVDASVEYDEYGNILGINGKPYYVFEAPLIGNSCDCISVTYTLVGEEPVTIEVSANGLIDGKNYYEFVVGEFEYALKWSIALNRWYFDSDDFTYLSEDTPCPFGTFTIEEGSIFEAFSVAPSGLTNKFIFPLITNTTNKTVRWTNLDNDVTETEVLTANKLYSINGAKYAKGTKVEFLSDSSTVVNTWTFLPQCECTYEPVKVQYLNTYGALITTWFYKANKQEFSVENSEFKRFLTVYDSNFYIGKQRQTFNTSAREKITVNSGWVLESYSQVIKDILTSEYNLLNDQFANVESKSIEIQQNINNGLINYQLTFIYSNDYRR